MDLLRGIRNLAYATLLSLLPASCGELSSCQTDNDCKESRVCEYNPDLDGMFCMTQEEAAQQQNTAEGNNRCGNSEFYGAHLREVDRCEFGTKEPLREDCTGEMDGKEMQEAEQIAHFTYFGNTFAFDATPEQLGNWHLYPYMNLVKNPSPSDFPSYEECNPQYQNLNPDELAYRRAYRESVVLRFLCFFEKDPTLYRGITDNNCELTLWRKTSYLWSDKKSCESEEHGAWFDECHEEIPWVDPADFDSTGW